MGILQAMTEENVEIVRLAYEVAYVRRSIEEVREKFPEDFVFHSRPEFPGPPQYTVDDMPQLWADLDDTYTEYELVPEDFTVVQDHVIVTIRQSALMRASDVRIETTIFHLWHVPDGTPRAAWAYSNRSEALQAASRGPQG